MRLSKVRSFKIPAKWFIKGIFLIMFALTIIQTAKAINNYGIKIEKPKLTNKTEETKLMGKVLGITNGKVEIYDLANNQIQDLSISVSEGDSSDTLRLSPDKSKFFISNGLSSTNESPFQIRIYTIEGKAVTELTPSLPEGYVYGKIATGTGFEDEYIAWERSGNGIVYQIHAVDHPQSIQYRYITLEGKDSLLVDSKIEEQTEEVIVGYSRDKNWLFVGSITYPNRFVTLHRIIVNRKERETLAYFQAGSVPLRKSISPDTRNFLGMYTDRRTHGVVIDLETKSEQDEFFPNAYLDSNGLPGFIFLDNMTAASINYVTPQSNTENKFYVSKVHIRKIVGFETAMTIQISEGLIEQLTNAQVIDISKDGLILTSNHVTDGNKIVSLQENFMPIAFIGN